MSSLDGLSDDAKLTVYRALRSLDLVTSTREEVAEAYYGALNGVYAAEYAALPAEMTAIIEKAPFDVTALFAIREADARNAIAAKITAEYSADYALNGLVLAAELKEAMAFLDSIDFYGTQVRVATGADGAIADGDMPGVREIFSIGEDELMALLEGGRESVTFGATVYGNDLKAETLTFTARLVDGEVKIEGGNTTYVTDPDTSDDVFAFVYTVTFKGYEGYAKEKAEELYNLAFSYDYFLTVDGVTYTRKATHRLFGDEISAYEVYRYFYDNSDTLTPEGETPYKDNAIVNKVLADATVTATE